jgi:S1-C subfamily serine protease
MRVMGRRNRGPFRPGLTLVELLAAIFFFGLMGALLLPRLAPRQSQAPVSTAVPADGSSDGACLPADHPPVFVGIWRGQCREAYVGIGAALDLGTSSDGYPRIDQPFDGGPAEAAGVEPGDLIQQVDGVPVQYESIGRVAALIRDGQIGTPVQLTIRRADDSQPLQVTVVRQCIHPPAPFDRATE